MKLKEYLKVYNLTSKEFAKKLGISVVTISRYMSGERFPSKDILKKISKNTEEVVTADDFKNLDREKVLDVEDINEIEKLAQQIKNGSRRDLAKAITMVESFLYEDKQKTEELISRFKEKKNSLRIGITGVPGVGKSTFIEALGLYLIHLGMKVAVIAVDPSSQVSGGSIMGDKTRMEKLSINENAFVRPSPNSGHLGGVSRKTRESIMCFEYADYDVIFVETMGVGQAETSVYNMVDIFLVLLLPSGGDDLQGIKKGIIELADLLIINKSDTMLKEAAENTLIDYRNALSIIQSVREDVDPCVLKCSALNKEGIKEIWHQIKIFERKRKKTKSFHNNRISQNNNWLWELLYQNVNDYIENEIKDKKLSIEIKKKMNVKKLNVVKAANLLLTSFIKKI